MKNNSNIIFNNRFVFMTGGFEAPEAPEKPSASSALGKYMDADTESYSDGNDVTVEAPKDPIKTPKGFQDMTSSMNDEDMESIVEAARKSYKEVMSREEYKGDTHGNEGTAVDSEGYEYKLVYDATVEGFKLFKSSEPLHKPEVQDKDKNIHASENLDDGYKKFTGKKANKISKAIKRLLSGEPPSIIINLDKGDQSLVSNGFLTQKEVDDMDGNVLYAVKDGKKIELFIGWAK